MLDRRTIVNMIWQLSWQSREARHTEEYWIPLNLWRELELLPGIVAQALRELKVGNGWHFPFAAGELLPGYDTGKLHDFGRERFQDRVHPLRAGRFYPKGLLLGFSGNPVPFRCTGLDEAAFTADFNHPLAGKALDLQVHVIDITRKRAEKGGECVDWLDLATWGPGMQARWQEQPTDFFADDALARQDEEPDTRFYENPRLVSHIDGRAQETLQALYGRLLKPGMAVLDLMSSWQSHLPEGLDLSSLTGLGLNGEELKRNPRLTSSILHDLNREPGLPFPERAFDAAICTVSVEYLTRPWEVFQELKRVVKPGGLVVMTFSHRWFPPKVIKVWKELHEFERLGLVLEYFLRSGGFANLQTFSSRGWPRPEDDRYFPQMRWSDPIYAVWGEVAG